MTPSLYAKLPVTKTLCSGDANEKYALNEIFIGGLNDTICHSMRERWGGKKKTNLWDLAFRATSVFRLQKIGRKLKGTHSTTTKPQTQRKTVVLLQSRRKCSTEQIRVVPLIFIEKNVEYVDIGAWYEDTTSAVGYHLFAGHEP